MSTFNTIPKFRFWCQKVLPLVYDDSLSYMELLSKVINYLNHVIEDVNDIPEYINELISDEKLKEIMTELLSELREQIARVDEGTSETASADRNKGELVWLNNKLVRMTRDILAGDRYVEETGEQGVTGNFVYTSVEIEINRLREDIDDEIGDLGEKIGDIDELTTTVKDSIVSAINELVSTDGDLTELQTTNKSSLVVAINEIVDTIGSLGELTTEDKTSVVNAINEVLTDLENNINILTYVNVLKIGVIPNDNTKGSENVSIINDHLSNGETLYFPTGTYYIDGTIVVGDGSGIFGRNPDKSIIVQLSTTDNAIECPVIYDPTVPTKVETCVRVENIRVYAPNGSSSIGLRIYNYTYEVTCHNDGTEYAAYKGNSYGLEYRNSIFRNIQITNFDIGLKCGVGTGVFNLNEFFIDTCGTGVVDQSADATFNEFCITYCTNAGLSANTTIANKYSNFKVYFNGGNGCTLYNCRNTMITNMNTEENTGIGAQFISCSGCKVDIISASNGFNNSGVDEYAKAGVAFSSCTNMVGTIISCDKNAAYFGGEATQTYGLTCDTVTTGTFIYRDYSNKYSYNELSDVTKANTILGGDVGKGVFTAGENVTIDTNYLNFIQYQNNVLYGTVAFTVNSDKAFNTIVAEATLPLPNVRKTYSHINYNEYVRGMDVTTGTMYKFKITEGKIYTYEAVPTDAHIVLNFTQIYSYM